MTADEHARVWSSAADRLDKWADRLDSIAPLSIFARTIAVGYQEFAMEQTRLAEATKRLRRK